MAALPEFIVSLLFILSLGLISLGLAGCGGGSHAPSPAPTAFSDSVNSLPGYNGKLRSQQYAGYVPVSADATDTTNMLFYYFIQAEEYTNSTPTLIWLNGGPGASSLMGFFVENIGPQIITGDGSVQENPHRMSKKYNLMAVDNPVGAGFSFTKDGSYVKDEEEMRQQFVQALRHFYKLHPELLMHPLWVTGESYAAKYIPNIVHELDAQIKLDSSSDPPGPLTLLTLKGMILGNGLYNASVQYSTISEFAYAQGVIDGKTKELGQQNESVCLEKIADPHYKKAGDYCENVTVRWIYGDVAQIPMYYDLGLVGMDLDSITTSMGDWLDRDDVKAALHVTGHKWANADETGPVADALLNDFTNSTPVTLVAEAAENGYRVALYNGVRDGSVCNHLGNTNALLEMDKAWKWKGEFAATNLVPMMFQDAPGKSERVAGYHRIVGNFSFTKLLNTGHLVPTVVPREFAQYIDWVTGYKPTDDRELVV